MESKIGRHLINYTLNLPPPRTIVENGSPLPFVLVGNEAFALTSFMMRPYSRANDLTLQQKIFNYRLSRARRMCFWYFYGTLKNFSTTLINKYR